MTVEGAAREGWRRTGMAGVMLLMAGGAVGAQAPVCGPSTAVERVQTDTTEADQAWTALRNVYAQRPTGRGAESGEALAQARERFQLQYRRLGLQFYERFPDDPRRWEWLLTTLQMSPQYSEAMAGADALQQAQQWDAVLTGRLGPQLLASRQTTGRQRAAYHRYQKQRLFQHAHALDMRDEQLPAADVQLFVAHLSAMAVEAEGLSEVEASGYISQLGSLIRAAALPLEARWRVARVLQASPHPTVRELAEGMANVLTLYDTPLELTLTRLEDGAPLDLADWRGKVVLVDFWSTSCTACIAAMPALKRFYERYHAQGFEMVAVAFQLGVTDIDKIHTVLARQEAPWTHALESWQDSALRARFGLTSVPSYLLLDRQGRLVATDFTGRSGMAALEQHLQRLLAQKARDALPHTAAAR